MFRLTGEHYYKEIEEITVRDFYQQMVDHPDVFPKTSMPSVQDFYEVFEKSVKENIPVICICITAKFSGSLQSATTAKDMILEEYPRQRLRSLIRHLIRCCRDCLCWKRADCGISDWNMSRLQKLCFPFGRAAGSFLRSAALIT